VSGPDATALNLRGGAPRWQRNEIKLERSLKHRPNMSAVQERKLGGEQQLERRQRQLTELEALEAMFGADGGFCVSDLDARDLVRGVVDSCNAAPDTFSDSLPLIGCRVEIAAAASVDKATDHAVGSPDPDQVP
jgi:hypothetical protein